MSLSLHTSNRMETLAAMLAAGLRDNPPADPFAAETILIQSRGMAKWLTLQLADARGISFHLDFPFPRDTVIRMLRGADGWTPPKGFTVPEMTWRLHALLPSLSERKGFDPIRRFLEDGDELKRHQLAGRLARLYDQYLVYRPDLILAWETDESIREWDAVTWREMTGGPRPHLAARMDAFRRGNIPPETDRPENPPARLSVFGISSLPPAFLDVLANWGRERDVRFYLLQPGPGYWGDLVTRKRREKGGPGVQYLETGHPLVPSLGRQGQDLLNLLIDAGFDTGAGGEEFIVPEPDTLLRQLQRDIHDLVDRHEANPTHPALSAPAENRSLQIHSCHSPLREIEVLHDQLLALFDENPGLRPRDVLVMAPDIETYAPHIEAVFAADGGDSPAIPHSVVDRRPRRLFAVIDTWFRFFDTARGRFTAREVTGLLETPPLRRRFDITDAETTAFRRWIIDTGVRWGIDPAHRKQWVPSMEAPETTWRHGIGQWLLGLVSRDHGWSAPGRCFPYDEMEGGNATLLRKVVPFLEFLFTAAEAFRHPRSPAAWADLLGAQVDHLFGGVEDFAPECSALRSSIHQLRGAEEFVSGEPLSAAIARRFLEETVDETASSGSFLSGGVTFCTLQPMRTVPARVIWLLGLDDGSFPRRPPAAGFDRMRAKPRPGDRSVREDDRLLFLETLLSARDVLAISHVGQSMREGNERTPSVLVSELLDQLDRSHRFPGGSARNHLLRKHRLQPFHPAYFGDNPNLFSYSRENEAACRRLLAEPDAPVPFFTAPLPPAAGESEGVVSPRELETFYRDPAAWFLKERLGLSAVSGEESPEDREPFDLDNLTRWHLKDALVEAAVAGGQSVTVLERMRGRGRLPPDPGGGSLGQDVRRQTDRLITRLANIHNGHSPEFRPVEFVCGDFTLRGEIGPFYGKTLLFSRPGNLRPVDTIRGWLGHLIATAAFPGETDTVLAGENEILSLESTVEPMEKLVAMLEWWARGWREPIRFFPMSSHAWFTQKENPKGRKTPLDAAHLAFEGDGFVNPGEQVNPAVALCWRHHPVETILNEEFERIALGFFDGLVCRPLGGDA